MRSDNLRPAPAWITPQMVRQVLALADRAPPMPELVPVVPVATPPVKPTLRIVERESDTPAEHARRTVVSPPSRNKTMAEKAAEFEARRGDRPAPAKIGPRAGRYANRLALYKQAEFRTLAQIAFKRGIAVIDLVGALQKPFPTVFQATKSLGLHFGRRPPLAAPLTKAVLLTLADESVPLPELRRDRRRREQFVDEQPAKICEAKQPDPDRAKIDRANKLRSDAARRRIISAAEALVDAGKTTSDTKNRGLRIAVRTVEIGRAEEARLVCPVEQAKTMLRRRFAPVCSMAVYDGDPDLFVVGRRKSVTREELLELAARYSA